MVLYAQSSMAEGDCGLLPAGHLQQVVKHSRERRRRNGSGFVTNNLEPAMSVIVPIRKLGVELTESSRATVMSARTLSAMSPSMHRRNGDISRPILRLP